MGYRTRHSGTIHETSKSRCEAIKRAATSQGFDDPINEAKRVARETLKERGVVGFSLAVSPIGAACLVAIDRGLTHAYAIAKAYNKPVPTIYRALRRLHDAYGLITDGVTVPSKPGSRVYAVKYALTEDGQLALRTIKNPRDKLYPIFDRWLSVNAKDSDSTSPEPKTGDPKQ